MAEHVGVPTLAKDREGPLSQADELPDPSQKSSGCTRTYTETAARLVARTQRRTRREYFVGVEEPGEDTERAQVLYRAAVGAGPAR